MFGNYTFVCICSQLANATAMTTMCSIFSITNWFILLIVGSCMATQTLKTLICVEAKVVEVIMR